MGVCVYGYVIELSAFIYGNAGWHFTIQFAAAAKPQQQQK